MQKYTNKNIFILLSIFLFPLFIFVNTPSTHAVGEICSTNASCCTPPQIIQDGGGCPSGTYWIGSSTGGSCQSSSLSCGTSFNCTTGKCTTVAAAPACPSGSINIGGGQCADWLKIIRYPSASTIYKIFYSQILGRLVYIAGDPAGDTCADGEVPEWDSATKEWVCAQGGLWELEGGTGPDIYYNAGNVGIGLNNPNNDLDVRGQVYAEDALLGIGMAVIQGKNTLTGDGVRGDATSGSGVYGSSNNRGVEGRGNTVGVYGTSTSGYGVSGFSDNGRGGTFSSTTGYALITGAGNVGIGTNTPTTKFHVKGGVRVEGLSCLESNGKAVVTDASGNLQCGNTDDGDWVVDTMASEMYNITMDYVGIGTNNPSAKLEVDAQGTKNGVTGRYNNNNYGILGTVSGANGIGAYGYGDYYGVYGNGTNIGVYGLGSTSGYAGVHGHSNASGGIGVKATSVNGDAFRAESNTGTNLIYARDAGASLDRFVVRRDGKVGINTVAPNAELSVVGSANVGAFNTASGAQSFSTGFFSAATGNRAVAMGNFNTTSGQDSVAIGSGNLAYANMAVAIGMNNRVGCAGGSGTNCADYSTDDSWPNDGEWGVAIGNSNIATGRGAVALGGRNDATGFNSFSVGLDNRAVDDMSVALGWGTTARAELGFTMGRLSEASGYGSVAWGHSIKTSGQYSWGIALSPWSGTVSQNNTMAIMGGRVGIGNTTPAYELEVTGRVNIDRVNAGALYVWDREALWTNGSLMSWGYGGTQNYFADPVGIGTNGALGGYKLWVAGSIRSDGLYVNGQINAQSGLNISGTSYFWNKLSIGGVPGVEPFTVFGRAKFNGSDAGLWIEDGTTDWFIGRKSSTNGDRLRFWFSGNKFEFDSAGQAWKLGGGSWANLSDIRLKDIESNYTKGLDEIVQLKPVNYHYKEGNERELPTDQSYVGFVAQDVQDVFPEAVSKEDDGYLSFDMHPVNVAVINAIKELKAENDELKERIEALENK